MAVSFDLPTDIEESLKKSLGDVSQAAKEAALIELYRHKRVTHRDLCRALGISRLQADELLKTHGVVEDLQTAEEYNAALTELRSGLDE
jgi:hypothetical protein